jgi:hypothetical protein
MSTCRKRKSDQLQDVFTSHLPVVEPALRRLRVQRASPHVYVLSCGCNYDRKRTRGTLKPSMDEIAYTVQ